MTATTVYIQNINTKFYHRWSIKLCLIDLLFNPLSSSFEDDHKQPSTALINPNRLHNLQNFLCIQQGSGLLASFFSQFFTTFYSVDSITNLHVSYFDLSLLVMHSSEQTKSFNSHSSASILFYCLVFPWKLFYLNSRLALPYKTLVSPSKLRPC